MRYVEPLDIKNDENCRKLIFKNQKINYDCFLCNTTGKIRNNKMINGKYVFQKTICPNCKGTTQIMAGKGL